MWDKNPPKGIPMNVKGLIGAMLVAYATIAITTRVQVLRNLAGL